MIAIVLAGGLGTRLRSVVVDVPKPLAPIAGKPFLHYFLQRLAKFNCEKMILSVGYKAELIREAIGKNFQGIPVSYSIEQAPLGTGGAIKKALQSLGDIDQSILILNGDTYFDLDLTAFLQFHQRGKFDLSIALREVADVTRSGVVTLQHNRVICFQEKSASGKGWINAGAYPLSPTIIDRVKALPEQVFSWEERVLAPLVNSHQVGGFCATGHFIDIGVPEDYQRAQTLLPGWTK